MYNIRPARPDDQAGLAEIWEESVLATHDFLSAADFEEIKVRLTEYFGLTAVWVYEEGGRAKGFIGVADDNIEMLFVGERRQGVGSRLLGFAVEKLGARRVDVNEQNPKALRFYEKHGFEISGRSETDSAGRPYPLLHMVLKNK